MSEEKAKLENEKLQLEIDKLSRDLNQSLESKKFEFDKEKFSSEKANQKAANIRSMAGIVITGTSLFLTGLVSYFSYINSKTLNETVKAANEKEDFRKDIERYDKLKSEFDNEKTSNQRKASIAYELMNINDEKIISKYDKELFKTSYENYSKYVTSKNDTIKASKDNLKGLKVSENKIAKLNEVEKAQVELENKITNTNNQEEREKFSSELKKISINSENPEIIIPLSKISNAQKELYSFKNTTAASSTWSTWLKKGYYREFSELTFTLESLNTKNQSGILVVRQGDNELQRINFVISQRISFVYDKYNFDITFNSIDNAGANPFTKALYFTITKTERVFGPEYDSSYQ